MSLINKSFKTYFIILILMAVVWGISSSAAAMDDVTSGEIEGGYEFEEYALEEEVPSEVERGKILKILSEGIDTEGLYGSYVSDVQTVEVEIMSGEFQGEVLIIDHILSGNLAYDFYLSEGDEVLLWIEASGGQLINAYISDFARDKYLLYMTIFFALMLIVVGGLKGAKTIVTLGITGFGIISVLLPLILNGYSPIVVTVLVAAIVTTLSLLIISGFNRKTTAAIMGTVGGVIAAGIIAMLMSSLTNLTGLSNDEAQMLMFIPQGIDFDFRGLLFAGMIIGALGAILDVGISVASSMDEIKRANPAISKSNLIKSGMNVGRDIMGTMSNTLILAYTGGAMPLLLVFMAYDTPMARIVNLDLIATEIVRALAGSIGLILAIPITAIVAGILLTDKSYKKSTAAK